ncbi:iron-siderophore ABC transporter substrate-binding protein (plasmid) [Rhizobium etli 8C-3]|uniref:Iron-siderophore ABC transporter substrate-binding protein n=1 Tax=Rhizobium etli 8C-3 TaxID=538025 RepID=A0A1L5P9P0_RHIET|nr:ABC transporter substrate-binding protein [Rhizobium etli]APO76909.1 iron-siderophore ABC transporter substrate-binding protein [Rhizobium etli 8C-3]
MTITRRLFCASLAATGLLSGIPAAAAQQQITVVDMAGREVHLPALPKRIILLEAHDLLTMSLLHPDPASLVVGWAAVDRIDSEVLQTRLLNHHPVAVVGKQSPDTVSLEGLIGLSPDLVVTTAFMTPQGDADPMVERLKQFGIPVVYSDASSNAAAGEQAADPVSELKTSMKMWGALLGATDKADAFTSFFDREMAGIAARVSGTKPVTTYLEVQSTPDDCCWAAGRKVWGELLALAGGQPLPGVTAPWFEKLSLEYLVSTPHDVYIASGGGWAAGSRPAIGPGIDPKLGQEGLRRLIDGRPVFNQLASVQEKRVYGIWTGLITNLPLNVVFVAQAAKWLHPEQCADLDPAAILNIINRDFAAFPIEGPLWASI